MGSNYCWVGVRRSWATVVPRGDGGKIVAGAVVAAEELGAAGGDDDGHEGRDLWRAQGL